ncbi:MAG: PAC2 family protein [Candidatus Heimdallarchaeota archaeon]|nr:PAC2 family protein [Candidatus Heimdallarchaeota archaeon]
MTGNLKGNDSVFGKSKIEFVLNAGKEDLAGCVLVSGFYGIGKVGFIAVNHMVQNLQAALIGYIVSDFLPPFLSVKANRLVLPFEIYRYENVVFINTYFEPYKLEHRSFAEAIVSWAKEKELVTTILIGGLDSRLRTDEKVLAKAVYTSAYKALYPKRNIPRF